MCSSDLEYLKATEQSPHLPRQLSSKLAKEPHWIPIEALGALCNGLSHANLSPMQTIFQSCRNSSNLNS